MEYIDVDKFARAIMRIQRVPLLGRLLRITHLSSGTSAFVLLAMAIAVSYSPFALTDPENYTGGVFYSLVAVACAVGLILFFSALGVYGLNKQAVRNSAGTFQQWIDCFFGPASRIPKAFPKTAFARIRAFLAFAIAVLLGIYLVASFPITLYQLVNGLFISYFALSYSTDPELIGRGAGSLIGPLALFVVMLKLQTSVWRYFRRTTSIPSSIILNSDHRKPILLLRSFGDDAIKFKPGFFGVKRHFEENLAVDLWREGPVVAIGKPGETLPKFGACREYHTDETWQNRVLELIAKSRSVILMIGLTEALGWEIHQLREQRVLGKCLFLVPPLADKEVSKRTEKFVTQVPELAAALSEKPESLREAVCVAFAADDKPICFTSRLRTPICYSVAVHAVYSRLQI